MRLTISHWKVRTSQLKHLHAPLAAAFPTVFVDDTLELTTAAQSIISDRHWSTDYGYDLIGTIHNFLHGMLPSSLSEDMTYHVESPVYKAADGVSVHPCSIFGYRGRYAPCSTAMRYIDTALSCTK